MVILTNIVNKLTTKEQSHVRCNESKFPAVAKERPGGEVQDGARGKVQNRPGGEIQDRARGKIQNRPWGEIQDRARGKIQILNLPGSGRP